MSEDTTNLTLLLGRLEGKMDLLLDARETEGKDRRDLEKRVGKLENARAWSLGAAAAVSTIVSALGALLGLLLHSKA